MRTRRAFERTVRVRTHEMIPDRQSAIDGTLPGNTDAGAATSSPAVILGPGAGRALPGQDRARHAG